MDVEDLARRWRRARRRWDRLNAQKLRLAAAGQDPPAGFLDEWGRARAEFEAAEEEWNRAYRMGVVIVVNDEEADAAEARLDDVHDQVVGSPLDDAPRLAYADSVEATDPERAKFIRLQVRLARLRRERDNSEPPGPYIREHALITARGTEWAADVRELVDKWQYLRGFVDVVWMDAAAFLATNAADDPTPRHADEYDADTFEATALQNRYGPRDWLSARVRARWPPDRDAVW